MQAGEGEALTTKIIATWSFGRVACLAGSRILLAGGSALDAVERGANAVEDDPDVRSVGYGGLPNAEGVVELDAAIMEGLTHRAGAVAALTGVRNAISVARRVMESTPHVMLAGESARRFALREGFLEAELLTEESRRRWKEWRETRAAADVAHFDTVGVCALDRTGNVAAGCSTSGLAWKLPGRVGDSPIVGSGLYADNEIGAAVATGNGDEIMRVCLSYRVVSMMEAGRSPQEACEEAIRYLLRKFSGQTRGAACVALDRDGRIGSAATRSGFQAPDRLWEYCCSDGEEVVLREGVYVDA